MLRILIIALLGATAVIAEAETRWCSIIGKQATDKVSYPPIAKAARVEGVVLSRIIYKPSGKVEGFEAVFGPPMLSDLLEREMSTWSVATDAKGDEMCETLIIATFRFKHFSCDPPPDIPTNYDFSTPSILRVTLDANAPLICDPAGTVTSMNPMTDLFRKLRRGLRRLFGGRERIDSTL